VNVDPTFILDQVRKPKESASRYAKLIWWLARIKRLSVRWVSGASNPANEQSRTHAAFAPWTDHLLRRGWADCVDPLQSPLLLQAIT